MQYEQYFRTVCDIVRFACASCARAAVRPPTRPPAIAMVPAARRGDPIQYIYSKYGRSCRAGRAQRHRVGQERPAGAGHAADAAPRPGADRRAPWQRVRVAGYPARRPADPRQSGARGRAGRVSKAANARCARAHAGGAVFQEQVMQVAILAAGFTPGEADQLRRAMAAWGPEGGLENYHQCIVGGMFERGCERTFADAIFSQIQGFGEYGIARRQPRAAIFAASGLPNRRWCRSNRESGWPTTGRPCLASARYRSRAPLRSWPCPCSSASGGWRCRG